MNAARTPDSPIDESRPVHVSRIVSPITLLVTTISGTATVVALVLFQWFSLKLQMVEARAETRAALAASESALRTQIVDVQRQMAGFEARITNSVSRGELAMYLQVVAAKNRGKIDVPEFP